eukprot:CAMPEP_0118691150 /NCGR_PEP_ID=MMETSP0800-20121206/10517_1 /TAXON_ID=210618 ORGANISM="Striatella unipunctata, Strain CCMP2910" /NCGR_SAMPLE_ID=MMETSP0800 /ASSEMBLY_ACC=CAM_ASM_000638 /LENGTH=314 /DNA_ID=CAMNT_0006588891 /DNA_START=111 /DNA_END=1055 /DNA_ORIENTATION=+
MMSLRARTQSDMSIRSDPFAETRKASFPLNRRRRKQQEKKQKQQQQQQKNKYQPPPQWLGLHLKQQNVIFDSWLSEKKKLQTENTKLQTDLKAARSTIRRLRKEAIVRDVKTDVDDDCDDASVISTATTVVVAHKSKPRAPVVSHNKSSSKVQAPEMTTPKKRMGLRFHSNSGSSGHNSNNNSEWQKRFSGPPLEKTFMYIDANEFKTLRAQAGFGKQQKQQTSTSKKNSIRSWNHNSPVTSTRNLSRRHSDMQESRYDVTPSTSSDEDEHEVESPREVATDLRFSSSCPLEQDLFGAPFERASAHLQGRLFEI